MMMTIPFTERLSETWLLERTYHARLHNGRELPVPDFTHAMKLTLDISVPLSTWQQISQAEAQTAYQQGKPVLLYGEHVWKHPEGARDAWRPNRHMRSIVYGNISPQPEARSGTLYAVCYLDPKRGIFSNAAWKAWFSSDITTIFEGRASSAMTFLGPCVQFPYTTHYTVLTSDGQIHEYADRALAILGFQALLPQEAGQECDLPIMYPQFCYYHEVTCPGGIYHLEFFGARMDDPGYQVKEAAGRERERMLQVIP